MPTAKDKGGTMSARYRPASEYDDATLAQKREYWRTKKREQRARRAECRAASKPSRRREQLQRASTFKGKYSSSFVSVASPLSGLQNSSKAVQNQKKWICQPASLNTFLPELSPSCTTKNNVATVKQQTQQAVNKAVTSPAPSESPLNTTFIVPPLSVTQISNGSCKPTMSDSSVFMQDPSVPKIQNKEQDALHNMKKTSPANIAYNTGMTPVFSSCDTISVTTEGARTNSTPLHRTQSALATTLRAKSNGTSYPPTETEEERAAKRRELWRIKKREQRARLAARIGNVRLKATNMKTQNTTAKKAGLMGALPLQNVQLKAGIQRQCPPRVKATSAPAKKENNKMQGVTECLTTVNLKTKGNYPHGVPTAQTSDGIPVKTLGESSRRFSNYVHLSNISRGFARCKSARQRFIEAQKSFMNLRNMRCKSPLLASYFNTTNIPKINPNDTPEQIIAKRREYWRVKKREQRAKLTSEVKTRLKEKDSLMRRVKRYQSILEEMRRARGLSQSAGGTLTQASETIGGFIKEDGTLTNKIPEASIVHTAGNEVLHDSSNNNFVTQVRHQPRRKNTKQYLAPPCSPQVKISLPGRAFNKLPKLHSVRERTLHVSASHNLQSVPVRSACQLTLTCPKTSQDIVSVGSAGGSNIGGCVKKMTISSTTAAPVSANSLDLGLSEEERMAKKREYWRIKKREQRAALAVRLKHGIIQARVSAALQRRRAQKQAAMTSAPISTRRTNQIASTQSQPVGSVPVLPNAHKIKQETESVPDADLNSCSEQALCPDIKRPTSPPAPQPECDPGLTGDTQATTLLAVASMKKLLEESLSTVTDFKEVQTNVKTEVEEDVEDQEIKPNLPPLPVEKDEGVPLSSEIMLHVKNWQPDTEDMVQAGSLSPQLKDSTQFSEMWPPIPPSSEDVPPPTCEHSSQTPSNVIIIPYVDTPDDAASQNINPGICLKQESCSPEPQLLPLQHQSSENQGQDELQQNKSPSTQSCSKAVSEHRGLSSLQRKREYWKLMKRQQRARLKAQQKERKGDCSRRLSTANIVAPAIVVPNTVKSLNPKPAPQHTPSISHLAADAHPLAINDRHSEETLAEMSCSSTKVNSEFGSSCMIPKCQRASQTHQKALPSCKEWMSTSTNMDLSVTLPTIKPPDNPLSRIKLQPIEPHGQTPKVTVLSPIKIPCSGSQSLARVRQPPTLSLSMNSLAPPKRIPGEPDEDFLRRKREYWRIKKKEQRARKAIHVKDVRVRRVSNEVRPMTPAEELPAQDSGQWVSSSDESQHLLRATSETGVFPFSNYTAQMEDVDDESPMVFADYETNGGEETSESYTMWRNHYLMDYDPLNQLLVCMVCGELQYTHSVEGARSHISDAHPETLTLDNGERQQILEAWDEQVSQRERFFTSQLQQHSGSLTGTHGT